MRKWFRSPWAIGITIALVGLIVAGYKFQWGWAGFSERTVWDWLQLLGVLAIPVAVAWYAAQQTQASEAASEQQHKTDLEIAVDNQSEAALQSYIDKMSELLLANDLGNSLDDG